MKIISNINDEKLRKEQFDVLVDVIDSTRNKQDLRLLLVSMLSESEKAYIGQRLNIMRMLAKKFNYLLVKEKINASGATISNAQKFLDLGGSELEKILLQYKFKPKRTIVAEDANPFKAHYPGSLS